MAAELDFQAIVDLVGDKLREVFHTGDIGIRWHDPKRRHRPLPVRVRARRAAAACRRCRREPAAPGVQDACDTRQPLRRQQSRPKREALGRSGSFRAPTRANPSVFVPILGGDRDARHDRRSRTTSARTRSARPRCACSSTVAASMGVALENARLFDETQRLLKETEQRAAELAIINSVQEGTRRRARLPGDLDLVGDKLREIFDTGDMAIALLRPEDRSRALRRTCTSTASGSPVEPSRPLGDRGMARHMRSHSRADR